MKRAAAALCTLLFLLLLWGFVEPRWLLDVREIEADVPNLPSQWEGRRIALVADLQIGMWLDNTEMVRRALRRAADVDPALVLIAGDFVYNPDSSTIRRAVEIVRPLSAAGIRVIAVFGNHDYGLSGPDGRVLGDLAAYLEDRLEAAGVTVLENESVQVDGLAVVGIGSEWAGRSRPAAALATVPNGAPRVVFTHNPLTYRDLPPHSAPLTLAAHTHGGQVRIPMTPSESWLDIARPREVIADGWAADSVGAPGNRAYVNRGLGFSIVPIRIRCRPELTLITLSAP